MTTGAVIWIIGWMFVFGLIISQEYIEAQEKPTSKEVLLMIVNILLNIILWPITLGCLCYTILNKRRQYTN